MLVCHTLSFEPYDAVFVHSFPNISRHGSAHIDPKKLAQNPECARAQHVHSSAPRSYQADHVVVVRNFIDSASAHATGHFRRNAWENWCISHGALSVYTPFARRFYVLNARSAGSVVTVLF